VSARPHPPEEAGGVRRATLRDLDRVAALWTLITRHHEPLDPVFRMRAGADDALRELLGAIHRDAHSAIFVYDDGGDLPGLCIVRIDSSPPIMLENERAEITDLGVRDDARRRGIASRLVDAAFDWIREGGISRVEVHVASANAEGQAFWRTRGFGDLMDVLHKRL
jgi:ribosomal protein S18 acetylase RimI-like enzyme